MSLMADLLLFLQNHSVIVVNSTGFMGGFPGEPDVALCVIPYGGTPPRYTLDGAADATARVQVQARAAELDHDAALTLATTAATAFNDPHNWMTILNGTGYQKFEAGQPGFVLPPDGKGRPIASFSVLVTHF